MEKKSLDPNKKKEAYDKVMNSIAISESNYEELSLVLRNNA